MKAGLHTPWSDEIELISFAPAGTAPGATIQDAQGYADAKEVKTRVFCTWEDGVSHVGIYVGDGQFIHSPQTGDVVKYSDLSSGYYANHYYGARRMG